MFAITGATGNTGGVVTEELLTQGEKVRVIGRDGGRLARFVQKGAEAFVADITDSAAVSRAFDGVRAVFAMVPQLGRVVWALYAIFAAAILMPFVAELVGVMASTGRPGLSGKSERRAGLGP